MAWTLVQEKANVSGGNSVTATLDSTPTNGNLLVACIRSNANATITIPGWTSRDQSGTTRSAVLDKIAASDGTGVTASCVGATSMQLYVAEYSGNDPAPFDTFSNVTVSPSNTTAAFPALTPEVAGQLYFATMSTVGTISATSFASEVFTKEVEQPGGGILQVVGSFINPGTGAAGTTLTWTSSRTGTGRIVTYKPAVIGGATNSGFFQLF